MNKPRTFFIGKKRIVVVSLFSGWDFFLLGFIKAYKDIIPVYAVEKSFTACLVNRETYKHRDGTPIVEPLVPIPKEEYDYKRSHVDERGRKDMADAVGIIDGQHYRTRLIQEVNGRDIRAAIEARYGKDVIILVIGGPPCQGYTRLSNLNNIDPNDPRNLLVLEYLRILDEISTGDNNGNVIGVMEEVPDFLLKKYEKIYEKFKNKALSMPFKMKRKPMISLHYGGHQTRKREIFMMVHNQFNAQPVFPEPDKINVKRVKDWLPHVDAFIMGGYDRLVRDNNHFMGTVVRDAPKTFIIGDTSRPPTLDERLLSQGVFKGDIVIPPDIPVDDCNLAVANGVCTFVSKAVAESIVKDVLGLQPTGDGYFAPIDAPEDPGNESPEGPVINPVQGGGDNTLPLNESQNPLQANTEHSAVNGTTGEDSSEAAAPVMLETDLTDSATERVQNNNSGQVNLLKLSVPPKSPVKFGVSGFTLWRGKSQLNGENIVAILTLKSLNSKTGDMAQLWVLNADYNPIEALAEGRDEAVCGSCILRRGKGGSCYVRVEESPRIVWKAMLDGAYPELPLQYFKDLSELSVRIAAYGDPAAVPLYILKELRKHITNWTGYTHQWREERFAELKSICMASTETAEGQREAVQKGWRTYRIIKPGDVLAPDEILCPELTRGAKCVDCQLCRGTSRKAKNIAIYVHGSLMNRFNPTASAAPAEPVKLIAPVKTLPPLKNVITGIDEHHKIEKPKIISSADLRKIEFRNLDFRGRWKELLGSPSEVFQCAIYGLPGHGKSSFAVQFITYLAENFGTAIYVSAEEGFSMTFRDKFLNYGSDTVAVDVADLHSFDEIMRYIPQKTYNFIVIDSLDRMHIDAYYLRKLKEAYEGSTLITISMSTKQGLMRGSNELGHDVDIAIRVDHGIAETTKNRFKVYGMTFQVFQ